MKTIKVILALSALWMLGGCIAVPVGPGYYPGSPGYGQAAPGLLRPTSLLRPLPRDWNLWWPGRVWRLALMCHNKGVLG